MHILFGLISLIGGSVYTIFVKKKCCLFYFISQNIPVVVNKLWVHVTIFLYNVIQYFERLWAICVMWTICIVCTIYFSLYCCCCSNCNHSNWRRKSIRRYPLQRSEFEPWSWIFCKPRGESHALKHRVHDGMQRCTSLSNYDDSKLKWLEKSVRRWERGLTRGNWQRDEKERERGIEGRRRVSKCDCWDNKMNGTEKRIKMMVCKLTLIRGIS